MRVAAIGLDPKLIEDLKLLTPGVQYTEYPAPPKIFVEKGHAMLGDPHIMDYYWAPDFVLWHGYFENPDEPVRNEVLRLSRLALAISNTPTYPSVRAALPWDDKMMGIALTSVVDPQPRSFFPPYFSPTLEPGTVLKWGNQHCGEGKMRIVTGEEPHPPRHLPLLSEPFIEGRSHRILLIQNYFQQLEYVSEDWRKNVGGTVHLVEHHDPEMLTLAQGLQDRYHLDILGVDFIKPKGKPSVLLEVNTYPELPNPKAQQAFCAVAAERIAHIKHA